jgi:two-component system response regulator AtoC
MARELGRPVIGFDEAALHRLRGHSWPGNVRELRNVIERAVLMAQGARIREADLALETRLSDRTDERGNGLTAPGVSLSSMERQLVLAALEEVGWVQKAAAELIGVSPRKLNYMIRRMHITHPSWRRNRASDPDRSESA